MCSSDLCVIVKNNSIISFGWNGMPTGYDNCCEIEVDGKLVTRPEVQHAELNAISKLAYNGYSSHGASIYITHSPCMHCSLLIQKCGIEAVYYHEIYRDDSGLKFLAAEVLYNIVREYIQNTSGMEVFDLYSGTGTIAQLLAPVAKEVIGVEIEIGRAHV